MALRTGACTGQVNRLAFFGMTAKERPADPKRASLANELWRIDWP
ncbi:hypothetical protein SAMN06295984_2292 [Sphingopyxis terrae subsp. ummariensis]|uniref:Uncharacterized protein n=1 Tax=Sphingopyxis terrae subsp. ummariensis TaxID=429001 RepID=A0A1Y6FQ13_9SPHN|nr:hypothetical protein SAMN06295984_2292 [Sphingopyxis terrae subsp. ummariensis]